jgi:HK97 family phage major capsid protein
MPQPQKTPAKVPAPVNTMDLLQARLVDLQEKATVVENVADAEQRSLTDDEVKQLKDIRAEFASVEAEIEVRNANKDMASRIAAPNRRQTTPPDLEDSTDRNEEVEVPRPARFSGGMPSGATKGSWGFRSMGEWAIAARRTKNGKVDPRIMNAPSTYGQEGNDADGGFAVPPDFRTEIMKFIQGEDSLLSRTDQQVSQSNSLSLPLDSTTPWQTSGGVIGGWFGEGQALTASKPSLGQLETKLNKLGALVPLTEELMQDVPAMTRWLNTKVPEKFNSLLNTAIVAGTGVGQPQGLLNAACKVTQAAVSGQGASTVVFKNITQMWGRFYAALRPRAVWLINQDVEQQLQTMVVPGGTPAYPAYLPPGGLSDKPYATLMGRPVLPFEACSALGTEGDIILTDLSQYLSVLKAGGMRSDVSIHLYFDSDHTAFRFVLRAGGQSYWPAAVTRQNGSNTLSPIVTLNSTRT